MAPNMDATPEHINRGIEIEGEDMAQFNKEEAFPRVSETQTPVLDALSSESESDLIPVSLSKRGGKMSKAKTKRTRKENQRTASSAQQSAIPSLRPAHDIMNRIRHDEALKTSDHVVGYEDRHVGIMWKGVDEWLNTIEEEDFIPLHRIKYFKRRSDDHVVWDREKRIDDIFGSGVTGGLESNDSS
ncbi:MAG: hypothetical protein Q9221_007639 [Calogaya cf. arnoldii]